MDPHSQALPYASSQEIKGGWGFTPALLLSPVFGCKSLLWLAVDIVHARSGHTAGWAAWTAESTGEGTQVLAVPSLQKQVLQVLGLPVAQL